MNDFIIKLVNNLIKSHLSKINTALDDGVKQHNLDPLAHVTSGQKTIGSLHIGTGTVTAVADYMITNLVGLSSAEVQSLVISSNKSEPKKHGIIVEDFTLEATLDSPLSADLAGKLVVSPSTAGISQGISGSVTFDGVTLHATGTVSASLKFSSMEVCVKEIHIDSLTVSYTKEEINVGELGVFSPLKGAITNFLQQETKTMVNKVGSQQVRNVLNSKIAAINIPCEKLS